MTVEIWIVHLVHDQGALVQDIVEDVEDGVASLDPVLLRGHHRDVVAIDFPLEN